MARISRFETMDGTRLSAHKTEVLCKFATIGANQTKLVQLNTYGSLDREMPGKISQTIQIDRNGAEFLVNLLRREFNL